METHQKLKLLSTLIPPFLLLILCLLFYYYSYTKRFQHNSLAECEYGYESKSGSETLIGFSGGEELTIQQILDAPGEVVAKSSYGTLYRAGFVERGSVMMMKFLRPGCAARKEEAAEAVRVIGSARHPNLVPLMAMYGGGGGEKLLVYPFCEGGDLGRFLKDGKPESHRWDIIYKLSLGILRGLDHLHNGLQNPIIHGNLKSSNILIDINHQPLLSDSGLHLLLNSTSAQEMLEASAAQGYKAPELIKMKDVSKETDIYSLGVIFLEILTRKEATSLHLPASLKNLFLEHKVSEMLSRDKNSTIEEGLIEFYHLALACCSPSPALRPDTKHIIRKLEEL